MKYILIILSLLSLSCTAQQLSDKQLHYAGGVFAGAWGTWVGSVYTPSPEKAFLIGMSITALAGVGKETLDMGTGGSPEFKDFTATMAGGFIGAGIIYLGRKIFKKKHRGVIFQSYM